MGQNVADVLWKMLADAGVKRCYGIGGDALNPVIDALHRNGKIEFIHVRHEEFGTFAAVADAYLTQAPVAVCGTAGRGVTHLINGLIDARKERASIIAICGDIETSLMDTYACVVNLCHSLIENTTDYGNAQLSQKIPSRVQTSKTGKDRAF